jgi:fructose-1,6-bisphosphatase/inositol monophosphatase family enzyme
MDALHFLDFGLATIKKARAFIHEKSKKGFTVSIKSDDTVVTEVDRETEQLIRAEIEKKFPGHGIVGEEFGIRNEQAEFKWYLDPIDGTISFSHGIPLYGTILALHQGDTPLVGIIDHPGWTYAFMLQKVKALFVMAKELPCRVHWKISTRKSLPQAT